MDEMRVSLILIIHAPRIQDLQAGLFAAGVLGSIFDR
jgi:hypothetical protein